MYAPPHPRSAGSMYTNAHNLPLVVTLAVLEHTVAQGGSGAHSLHGRAGCFVYKRDSLRMNDLRKERYFTLSSKPTEIREGLLFHQMGLMFLRKAK